jgi:hypothetical protein
MSITVTPYLRNVLLLDGLVSGAAGLVMAAGATLLGPFLGLPEQLLFWAGVVLLPWCAALVLFARRPSISRLAMLEIVAINGLWVVASFGIMVTGLVQPNLLGVLFVSAQALTVALFLVLQVGALRAEGVAA